MPLKLQFRSGERFVLNGANVELHVVQGRVELVFLNEVRILKEYMFMDPAQAVTPLERLYVAIQAMYVGSYLERDQGGRTYSSVSDEIYRSGDAQLIALLEELEPLLQAQQYYQVLSVLYKTLNPKG